MKRRIAGMIAAALTLAAAGARAQEAAAPVRLGLILDISSVVRDDTMMVHSMYLFRMEMPAESKGPWDLYKPVATAPPGETHRPLARREQAPARAPLRTLQPCLT